MLLGSALLPWYGGSVSPAIRAVPGVKLPAPLIVATSLSGWEAFTMQRWLWLAVGLGGLAVAAGAVTGRRLQATVSPAAIVMGLGGLVSVCIVFRLIDHPHAVLAGSAVTESVGIQYGAYVGLAAAVVLTRAAYLVLAADGIGLADVRQQINRALGDESAAAPAPVAMVVPDATLTAAAAAADGQPAGPPTAAETPTVAPAATALPTPPPGGIPPMAGRSQAP